MCLSRLVNPSDQTHNLFLIGALTQQGRLLGAFFPWRFRLSGIGYHRPQLVRQAVSFEESLYRGVGNLERFHHLARERSDPHQHRQRKEEQHKILGPPQTLAHGRADAHVCVTASKPTVFCYIKTFPGVAFLTNVWAVTSVATVMKHAAERHWESVVSVEIHDCNLKAQVKGKLQL